MTRLNSRAPEPSELFTVSADSQSKMPCSRANSGSKWYAALILRVLGKEVKFEQVTVPAFLELLGILDDAAKTAHF